MKAWEFDAVHYGCDVWCVGCLPGNVDVEDPGVDPIFASSEVDEYPVCSVCGAVHDYMGLTAWGHARLRAKSREDDEDEAGTYVRGED